MRRLLLFLVISSMMPFALSQENSPSQPYSRPLTELERRIVYGQLLQYKAKIVEVEGLKDLVKRQEEQAKLEKEIWDKSIEIAHKETALAEKELELEKREHELTKQERDFYKEAYQIASHKPGGFGCALKVMFTLGLARCH